MTIDEIRAELATLDRMYVNYRNLINKYGYAGPDGTNIRRLMIDIERKLRQREEEKYDRKTKIQSRG